MASVDLTSEESDDGSLSPIYRTALRCEEEGMTPREIAIVLDVAVESVPLMLDLARRKLNSGITAKHAKG